MIPKIIDHMVILLSIFNGYKPQNQVRGVSNYKNVRHALVNGETFFY
jgi:hypothetical protein